MSVVKTAHRDTLLVRELGILVMSALVLMAGLSLLVGCERGDYRAIPGDSIRSGWSSPERPSAVAAAPSQQDFLVSVAEAASSPTSTVAWPPNSRPLPPASSSV